MKRIEAALEFIGNHLVAFVVGGVFGLLTCIVMGSGFALALILHGDHTALRVLTGRLENPAYGIKECEFDKTSHVTCTYIIQGEIKPPRTAP